MRRARPYITRITSGILANPVARTVAAIVLFAIFLGGLALTAYTDDLLNGGVTYSPTPPGWEPPPHTDVNPMGVNLFLEKEVDPANITRTLQMVKDGGFTWARQGFAWNDIEISAKGNYTDTRNPGPPVDAWAKYDRIVDAYNRYGIEIIARLDSPPTWARKPGADLEKFHKGPPRDNRDYADFAAAVAERYRGRIKYFQIWNEPNLHGEWGGEPINAAEYVALLKAAQQAIKRVNPEAVIITAALAPTAEDSVANQNDILFLEAMYRAGAAPYFDILSTMLYGLGQSPNERRTDLKRLNFSRPILLRQVMERNGDLHKPIWISEYAWVSLPPDFSGDPARNIWGESVDEETQARWLVEGYERARREWPWMGVMSVWYFREPELKPEEPAHYFSIVWPDYTPRPAYDALKAYSQRLLEETTGPVTSTSYQEDILDMDVGADHGQFGTFTETLRFTGTGLQAALCRFCSVQILEIDGRPVRARMVSAHPQAGREGDPIRLLSGLPDGEHNVAVQGNWGRLIGENSVITYRSLSRPPPPEKPLWNALGFPLLYGVIGLFALASAVFGLASLGRWAGAALDRPRGLYPEATRELARNGAVAVGMALLLGLYYRAGSVPLMFACLAGWAALAYIKPSTALAFVAATLPFFWLPKEIGQQKLPVAETLLVLTFAAVLARRIAGGWLLVISDWWQRQREPRNLGLVADVPPAVREQQPATRNPQPATITERFRAWSRQDPLAPPAVALLILGTISLLFLADPTFAKDSFRAYRWVIVEPVLFYFLLTDVVSTRRGPMRLADFFVGAAVLVSLVGLWQYLQGTNVLVVEGVKRVQSVYQHPNNLALYLGRVVPFAACLAIYLPWGWRKTLYALATFPLAACLVLTFSRGALIAVTVAMVAAVIIGWWLRSGRVGERKKLQIRPRPVAFAAALIALLVVVIVLILPILPPRIWNLGSGLLRLEIWESSLKILTNHPITGVGIDQFYNQFRAQDAQGNYIYMPEGFQESFTSHAHNLVLDWWLALGIMGVPLLVWLLWRYFRLAIARIKSAALEGDQFARALGIGLFASMGVFVVHGLVDNSYFFMDLAMIFWLCCGMLVVSGQWLETNDE